MNHLLQSLTPRRAATLAILMVLLLCAGCSDTEASTDESHSSSPPRVDAWCVADAECFDDEVCRQGLCSLESSPSSLDYGLILTPPNNSSVPAQRIAPETHPTTGAEFRVHTTSTITGTLQDPSEDPAPDGTLALEPIDAPAPGALQTPVRNGEFELHLVPGEYGLKFIVDDERWPRIHLPPQQFSDATNSLELQVPHLNDLRTVSGELTREALELLDLLSEPVQGAKVVARGVETGYRSTVAVTDEEGQFALRLPPDEETFDVLIEPGPENLLVPRLTFAEEITPQTDELSLSVGELDFDLISASIELSAEPLNDQSIDWEDYRIILHQELDTGELFVTPSIDDDGHVEIELLGGTYVIDIIAPLGAPWSSTREEVTLLDPLSTIEIELTQRQRVTGSISNHIDQSIGEAKVRVEPENGSPPAPPPVYSDADGQFELWLDAGEYRAMIRSPISLGLPYLESSFAITEEQDQLTLSPRFDRSFVATGEIKKTEGEPLSHASLQAFRVDDSEDIQIIGESFTDGDGSFRIVTTPQIAEP